MPDPNLRPNDPPAPLLQNQESTQGRMTGLLSSDSDYMRLARTQGETSAAQRGLLNSSIAVGASQDAATRAAMPIASDDANRAFQRTQGVTQFGQAKELSSQEAGQQRQLQAQGESARAALSEQEAKQGLLAQTQGEGARSALSGQESQQQLKSQTQAEGARSTLSSQESAQNTAQQLKAIEAQGTVSMGLAKFNSGSAQKLAQMENTNRVLLQGSAAAREFYSNLGTQLVAIAASPDLSDDAKRNASNALLQYGQDFLNTQSQIYTAAGITNTPVTLNPVTTSYGGGVGTQGSDKPPPHAETYPTGDSDADDAGRARWVQQQNSIAAWNAAHPDDKVSLAPATKPEPAGGQPPGPDVAGNHALHAWQVRNEEIKAWNAEHPNDPVGSNTSVTAVAGGP